MTTGRVSPRLLEERQALMSRAMERLPPEEVEILAEQGLNPLELLRDILEDLIEENSFGSLESRFTGRLRDHDQDIPWTSLMTLLEAMGRGVGDLLISEGGGPEARTLYSGLLELQSEIFRLFTSRETERKQRTEECRDEISRFPETIAATLDPSTLAKTGMDKLRNLLQVEECLLLSLSPKGGLEPITVSPEGGKTPPGPLELRGDAAETVIRRGYPFSARQIHDDTGMDILVRTYGEGPILLVPVKVRGRTTGAIMLRRPECGRRFNSDEVEVARSFSCRLSEAMENAYLHAREQQKIKMMLALLEIARVMSSTLDLQEILGKVVRMTVDLCGVSHCGVYLLEDDGLIHPAACYGFVDEALWQPLVGKGFEISSLGRDNRERLAAGDPLLLPSQAAEFLLPAGIMREHGVDSVLFYPLNSKDRWSGIFTLFYNREEEELDREELGVVGTIAAQASLAIENAALYEDIERSYYSTVKALARAIEVKDPYTHGHSERVTGYALLIAEAMGMDEREKQKLKYAATLHDIGKIGIAGRVLNKPGALTDEEYLHVKTHPLLGDSIIEPVEFLQGPRPIILHHHERYDGKGYPDGLKGEDIPLCARVLSVADAYEAMRSDRPYRKALCRDDAVGELKRNSGTQFDPKVVEIFLRLIERGEVEADDR